MTPKLTSEQIAAAAVVVAAALWAYGRWLVRLRERGGRVSTTYFRVPELMVAVALCLFVAFNGVAGFFMAAQKQAALDLHTLALLGAVELIALASLCGFLAYRGMPLRNIIGTLPAPWARIPGYALLFLALAVPLVAAVAGATRIFAPGQEEQIIVTFAREQARSGSSRSLVALFVSTAFIAPLAEEFFFRGFFYPAIKSFFGPVLAALITASLFALAHSNLQALAPLFILALCFTIAYEWTGSLLVPFTMHLLFNSANLAVMLWSARSFAP